MDSTRILLSVWKDGYYRAAAQDPRGKLGSLIEFDGHGAERLIGVTRHGFEEIVATRRAVRNGVCLTSSAFSGGRDGSLEWHWKVDRPGLRREEIWKIDPHGKGSWHQVDVRPARTTTYHSTGPGQFHGEVRSPSGKTLWTSNWESDGRGGLNGDYTDAEGDPAGSVSYPGPAQRNDGALLSWSGPASEGAVESSAGEGNATSVRAEVKTEDGITTYTWNEGNGHSVQTGTRPGGSWIKITVPGSATGESQWVEMGTEPSSKGSSGGMPSNYTVNGQSHADGSATFSRVSNNPVTGDKETTFGGTDADGNLSYSSRVEHSDGSVTIITRSLDKDGNGTEHVTDVDAQGNVTKDETYKVEGGKTVSSDTDSGASGGQAGDNSGSGGTSGDDSAGSGVAGSGDSGSGDSGSDPNNPGQPDSPDSPDSGGSGSGMPSDDGSDDRAPGIPLGKIGSAGGESLDALLSGIRAGNSDSSDDDQGAAERNERWARQLMDEIQGAGSGAGGGADDTGWGSGEGPRGTPLFNSIFVPPPPSADEGGWGDLNNPRALAALVATLGAAAAGLARTANLVDALRR